MDRPRLHTECSKLDKERQISYDFVYIWNLKKGYKRSYLQNRNGFTDIENKLMAIGGGER